MPSTINLRRKIKSVTNTKQITKAMQMVAASKMRRAQEAVTHTRAYAQAGEQILQRIRQYLHKQEEQISHPLLLERPVKKIVLLVVSSDRGLAGAYNSNVLRQTVEFLENNKDKQISIVTVGKKIQDALLRVGVKPDASFVDFPGRPVSNDIVPIAKLTIDAFTKEECDEVTVIYTHFHTTLKQVAQAKRLLPIAEIPLSQSESESEGEKETAADYIFEPGPREVLTYIIPRMVEMQLLQCILNAIASEHSSRMLAMKNATDNATDLIGDLKLTYNSVRQASITQEIAEISAGTAAGR